MQSMSSTFNFVDNGDWLSKIANTGDLTWLLLVALLFIVIRICIYYMFSESENFVLARLSSLKCVKFINVHISKKFIAIVCSSITAAILISIVTLNIAKAADEEYENYNYIKLSCSLLSSDVYVDEQGVDRAEPIVLNNDNNIADVHIHSISLSSDNPEVLSSKWVIKFEGKEIFNDYPDSEVKFSTPIRIAANSSANFPVGLSMESSLASSLIGTHPVKIECSLMNAFQEDAFSLIDVKLSEFKKFIDSLQNIDDAEKERLYRELVESADDLRGVIAQLTGYEEIFDSLWKWYNKSFDKIKELTGTSIDNIKEDFFNQLSSFNNLPKDIIDDYIIRFNDFYDLFNGQLDDVDAVDSLIILINDFKDDVKSLLDEAKKNDNKSFWTVTFVSNGESETKSQSIKYGKCVQEPQVPTKFGYTFLGWYSSSDLKESTQWNFNVSTVGIDAGDKDLCILTLYGKWTKTTYQVTYFENGSTSGNVPDKQFKVHDEELILSSNTGNLRKNKNFFIGWNTASDGTGVHYDEGDSYNENKELNLYAHWQPTAYVEFNMMEHGTQVDRLEIPIGQKVSPVPSDPSDAGYNFKGWYKEKECLNLWNFDSDIIAADTTLYAKWEIKTYTVRYNANGSETGNNPESQTKYYGRSLQLHDDDDTLSKDGYALTGWNTSSDGKGTHYDLKGYYSDNKDILLYAEWTVSLTVTFDVRGHGTAPEPMHVAKGWKCKKPFPDPTDDAYQFIVVRYFWTIIFNFRVRPC